MMFLIPICVVTMLLYMLKIGIYSRYWKRYPAFYAKGIPDTIEISVVVAFRNEQENLPGLLNSLEAQQYPVGLWEVILVDDHSTDRSSLLVKEFINRHTAFHYLQNEPHENGKKAAMLRGIRHASHKVIVTTDADCTMGEYWLSTICRFYSRQGGGMLIGPVDMVDGRGFFKQFQELEFISLVAAGAAAVAGGRPLYCNAANLAFEKELMLSFSDPLNSDVPSGDDTLFMLRIKRDRISRIMLLKSPDAAVRTRGTENLRQFMNQRSRWASKSRYYTDRDVIYTSCLVLAVSILMAVSLALAVAGIHPWLFLFILAAKSLADYYFLGLYLRFYRKKMPGILFILFELIYPVYLIAAVAGGIISRYTWKGRKYFATDSRG